MRRGFRATEQTDLWHPGVLNLCSFNPVAKQPWLFQALAMVGLRERGRGQR